MAYFAILLFLKTIVFVSTEIHEEPEDITEGFILKTEVCSIRDYDPFDINVKEFIFDEEKPICNEGRPALIKSNLTSIFIVEELFMVYNIFNMDLFRCCYKKFGKEEARKDDDDDHRIFYKTYNCTYFNKSAIISDQFIKVVCFYTTRVIYVDYITFFIFDPKATADNDNLNILVLGFDGISRLNFRRQMPKMVSSLTELEAVEFLGFNKLSDNTFPNIMAVLTGLSEDDLKVCWPNLTCYFDDCPFIWKLFKAKNFTTVYGEDWHYDRSTFRTGKQGFRSKPTDYYYGIYASQNGDCLGSRAGYVVLLEFLEKFVRVMLETKQKYFGFFWENDLSHELLNKPKLGDDHYTSLLTNLNHTGILNDTVLIVMSDHGMRYGPIRSTGQGYMEDRLPVLWIYLPKWYRIDYPMAYSNLMRNRRRLTSHFDVHKTLLDLLDPYKLTSKFLKNRMRNNPKTKGLSLLGEIPKSRTCKMAGLTPNWCACQLGKTISAKDAYIFEFAELIVAHVNNLLQNHTECAELVLVKPSTARVLMFSFEDRYYTITLTVNPSQAILQGVVNEKLVGKETELQVVGIVTRLNRYGNQSHCVDDYRLKMYCFC